MVGNKAYKIARDYADKNTIGDLAKKIGYARSSVNLYLRGNYTGNVNNIENKILSTFTNRINCPFLQKIISKQECEDNCKTTNAISPSAFKLQQFCKTCPFRDNTKEEFRKQFLGD